VIFQCYYGKFNQEKTMSEKPNQKLVDAFKNERPANPALSAADKSYLRGLRRQGYTQDEITNIAGKSGFAVPADLFATKRQSKQG
jgi:hypothetical protein